MNRHASSWFGSLAIHAGALAWLSVFVAVMPVQIGFKRGRTSIELQATIAAAPKSEAEPTAKLEPTPEPKETKPVELTPVETVVERRPAKPPEPMKPVEEAPPEVDPLETAVAALDRPAEKPPEEPVDVQVEPPQRVVSEAKPRDVEAPVVSAAAAASQADAGAEYDELPQPHPLNRQPPYPRDAYVRRQQGTVVLHLQVTSVGAVGSVRVARSSGIPSLDEAAIEAARGWRYTPARRGGTSMAMVFETHVNFTIGG
jgi:protein TonB